MEPWANEYYTKLYVFQLQQGPKATGGPFRWGYNLELFHRLDWLHRFVASIWEEIKDEEAQWLLQPDPAAGHAVLAWTIGGAYLCVVNFGREASFELSLTAGQSAKLPSLHLFSTHGDPGRDLIAGAEGVVFPVLAAGEGKVWGLLSTKSR